MSGTRDHSAPSRVMNDESAETAARRDAEHWREIKALFEAVAEAEPERRAAALAAAPPAVRQRVEELLAFVDRAGPLDRDPLGALEGLPPVPTLIGRRLGAYRVVGEIGRGGMGTVYEGLRDDAFTQRVAIKTLRLGGGIEAIHGRFQRERQFLADLQHPRIAALYDGGVTEDGIPYLVLEFVDGVPIDRWATERSLGVEARLELFQQVVEAVDFAHRHLVVHRDLKPGNILVDRDGNVKLVDFGIAKLLGADDSDATAEGWHAFTTAYASPEQLAGGVLSTATDVYALGVVLHRLLSGAHPFGSESRSPADMLLAIRSGAPLPPSASVTVEAAKSSGFATQAQLAAVLRGELDAIVLMALRVEPERRYPSVESLGEDIRRYLGGLPVRARPDTLGYRARKFLARRRALAAGVAIAVVALLSGTGVALWQARSARAEAHKAGLIADFLQKILGGNLAGLDDNRRLPQANLTLQEVLDTAAVHLPQDLGGEPLVRATLHDVLGNGYLAAMRFEPARAQFDSARAIHRRELGANAVAVAMDELDLSRTVAETHPDSGELLVRDAMVILARNRVPDTAAVSVEALEALATWQAYQGKLDSSEVSYRRMIAAEQARADPRPAALGAAYSALGLTFHNQGKMDSAEAAMRHGIAVIDSSHPGPSSDEASYLYTFGTHLTSKGKAREALPVLARARDMAKITDPPSNSIHLQVQMALADAMSRTGDTAAANAEGRAALAKIAELTPGSEIFAFIAEYAWAGILRREGAGAEAEAAGRREYATGVQAAADVPYYLADANNMLGGILSDRGKYPEAEQRLLEAYRIARDNLGTANFRTARASRELALLYLRWGRAGQAAPYLAMVSAPEADSLRRAAMRR